MAFAATRGMPRKRRASPLQARQIDQANRSLRHRRPLHFAGVLRSRTGQVADRLVAGRSTGRDQVPQPVELWVSWLAPRDDVGATPQARVWHRRDHLRPLRRCGTDRGQHRRTRSHPRHPRPLRDTWRDGGSALPAASARSARRFNWSTQQCRARGEPIGSRVDKSFALVRFNGLTVQSNSSGS